MNKHFTYLLTSIAVLASIFVSCTQYKNKPINRGYHNMTSRYNVYFYSRESLKEGVAKLEENNKDDYSNILPVFIYGDKETCKEIYPEMDRVIKKSSLCITRHAIKDKKTKQEIFGAVKWIDNAWMELGKAQFYKREFFSAIETFEFVEASYKSNERYEAWLWLLKTYNEMGLLSKSDPYISQIKNEKKFPAKWKDEFEALHAEFYLKQGLYEEAAKELTAAISHTKSKKVKARYYFILGQITELNPDDQKKAASYFRKVIAKKPYYEMEFNARIKLTLLADYNSGSSSKLKTDLRKMLKDIKNDEYQDVIYYTLGLLEERDGNLDDAFVDYKKSAAKSINNNIQKSKSYLRIAEMSFDREDYPNSKAYYDSTLAFMKEDVKGYKDVVAKQKSLDVLVGHITTIKQQDSLLRIANMDSASRNEFIAKMIDKLKDDEKKAKEDAAKKKYVDSLNALNAATNNGFQPSNGSTAWYFYNTQTKTFGVNDFIKKWGNQRKNEDNWRRLNKQAVLDDPWDGGKDSTVATSDSLKAGADSLVAENTSPIDPYLKDLPLTKALQDSANNKILNAYYSLGTIYREQLNNNKRAVSSFNTMNQRYPGNEFEASSYYQMYRIYLQEKNQPKADECKNFILNKYPNSDYAKILTDPDIISAINAKKGQIEAVYTKAYDAYLKNDYSTSLSTCNDALRKYSKNEYTPKFAFLRALCIGKTQSIDSLSMALTIVTTRYPDADVYGRAKDMLDAINKMKNPGAVDSVVVQTPNTDPTAYVVADSTEHYWVVCIPPHRGDVAKFKEKLTGFNNQYYSVKNYQLQTLVLGDQTTILTKSFQSKEDAMSYHTFITQKQEIFSGLQMPSVTIFAITSDNLIKLISKKNIQEYKKFFIDNYEKKNP